MSDYKPVKGDRVRVVLEGEVAYEAAANGDIKIDMDYIRTTGEHVVSIEKIEPPAEVFIEGTVRTKGGDSFYSLAPNGYFSHQGGGYFVELDPEQSAIEFTSKFYERVELG